MSRSRAVATAVVLALAVGGCSLTPGRTTGSAAPPAAASDAPAPCTVEGFVPVTRLVTLGSESVVLYGTRYTLAPASSVRFTSEMSREAPVRLRVSVRRGGRVVSSLVALMAVAWGYFLTTGQRRGCPARVVAAARAC